MALKIADNGLRGIRRGARRAPRFHPAQCPIPESTKPEIACANAKFELRRSTDFQSRRRYGRALPPAASSARHTKMSAAAKWLSQMMRKS